MPYGYPYTANPPMSPFQMGMNGIYSPTTPGTMFPQSMPQPPAQSAASNVDWVQTGSLAEAQSIPVQPGQKLWIMLMNEPIFVVKSVNETGQATMQAFKFEPYTEEPKPQIVYATQSELEALRAEIEELKGVKSYGKPVKRNVSEPAAE